MKEEIMELLSAYLDNQVSDEQRRKVEHLLKTDREVKQEFDEMRTFCEQVTQSKPDAVAVPGEFRQSIMNRLAEQVPVDQQTKKQDPPGGAGSGGWMKNNMLTYLLSGTVLVGLIGTFAYLDKQTSRELKQVDQVKTDILNTLSDQKVELPQYKGGFKDRTVSGDVHPDDIQSVAKREHTMERLIGKNDLTGSVYVQGTAGSVRGSAMDVAEVQPGYVMDQSKASHETLRSKGFVFEGQQVWTTDKIKKFYNGRQHTNAIRAKELVKLADDHRLNPGLLVAAMQSKPDIDILDAAPKMRLALDANQGATDKEKLHAVIHSIGGSADWFEKWEPFLR